MLYKAVVVYSLGAAPQNIPVPNPTAIVKIHTEKCAMGMAPTAASPTLQISKLDRAIEAARVATSNSQECPFLGSTIHLYPCVQSAPQTVSKREKSPLLQVHPFSPPFPAA